jgi:stage V sporulation protein K
MKKKTSYPLTIFLSTLSTFIPILAVFGIFYSQITKQYETPAFIFFIVAIAQWVFLRQPLKDMYQKAIQDNEYDEFGRSKKKSYANLTRKEREEMDLQKTAQMEQLLSSSVIKKITKKGSTNPEKDLDELIGLAPVKTKVTEMVARMKFERDTESKKDRRKRKAYGANGRHFVFYGSAGTGKTSVARIITGFLYEYGYIRENKCIEIDGNFLKAGELSDTKTKLVIGQAYGGVLFIDEAYTIIDGGQYGKAVIATLIKEMEDNRDKFTVILAGYKNDMKRLLDTNEGFKSRIKEYLEFCDYSSSEMQQIFVSMANVAGFVVSSEALENFEIRCDKERKRSSFGNGRTARNILDETLDRHALNYGKGILSCRNTDGTVKDNKDCKFIICEADVSTQVNTSVL